jgi:hypothetical protein
MSNVHLNKEEIAKLFRMTIRESGKNLRGDDKMLAQHLSNVIQLDESFGIDNEYHIKSLKYLDEITGVLRKFEEEVSTAVIRELGL